MTVHALLWDLDGTLVDSEPLHARSTDAALAELGLATPPEFHLKSLGLSAEQTHEMLVEEAGLALALDAWELSKLRQFEALASDLVLRQPAARLAEWANGKGLPQAVVSNSSRGEVDLALSATGLSAAFAVSISRNDVGKGKPDPEGYLKAADIIGAGPSRCLAIEDSVTGTQAALAAGVTAIFHPQLPHAAPPHGADYLPPEGDLARLIHAYICQADP